MIREFKAAGFKSLNDLTIELGRINVFVGANGSGKSNVLEAIGLLSAAASGRVDDESLSRRGVRLGLPRLYKTSFKSTKTLPHIRLSAISDDSALYQVALLNPLTDPKPAWSYKTERLDVGDQKVLGSGVRTPKEHPERGLAALKLVELGEEHPATHLLTRLQNYAIYCPNTPTLRGMIPDQQQRTPLGLFGGGLAEALRYMGAATAFDDSGRLDDQMASVLDLIDWIKSYGVTARSEALLSASVPRQSEVIRFTDRFMAEGRNALTAYDASEGALYIIFAAILALAPTAPSFLAIDNIDQALNPRLARQLMENFCQWVLAAGKNRQVLCTTHNPAMLDGLPLDDDRVRLFTVDRNNEGHTQVRRIQIDDRLAALSKKKDWPLSRLWVEGYIGGVPNV